MPRRHMHMAGADGAALRAALRELRTKLDVPGEFPPEVLAEAEQAVRAPRPPDADATDLPLFTIDPPPSRDLDQAMHLERRPGGGYRVHYAIADVAAFVTPGGALDAEAHRRVSTLYFPDGRVPLHPPLLSEGAASLLPGQTCPALLWRLDLDSTGRVETTDVRRALVRSRAKLDYDGVQHAIDSGTGGEALALLAEIGRLREALEQQRGGISLNVPEQEVVVQDGSYALAYRAPLPADGWNAQISLMTGMAAAELMLAAGTGILRTLPTAPDGAVGRLRRAAKALRTDWPHHMPYAELVRSLDPHDPAHAAFLQECTTLLRGAGYTVFTGGHVPDPVLHAAVAAPYAHCTAPLRRLVDRYAGELCVAAVAGAEPPAWAVAGLAPLPQQMAEGVRLANTAERECVDLVEAAVLQGRIGETFDATVIDIKEHEPLVGTVQLEEPAVVGRVESSSARLPLGDRIRVRLTQADPGRAKVLFAAV
ncbi:RNB domain-containing ribonuclease [Streptomyces sp. NPDC044571]|uniref:RNB domain-containing ribonuclease n=1 Tax=Streptomyces sp. NPDC044571 TaxID=3155371 RepID=UPI0033DCD928